MGIEVSRVAFQIEREKMWKIQKLIDLPSKKYFPVVYNELST